MEKCARRNYNEWYEGCQAFTHMCSAVVSPSLHHNLYAFWVSYTAKVYQAYKDANVGLCSESEWIIFNGYKGRENIE